MNINIIYITNSGSTFLVARQIAHILQSHGHTVNMCTTWDSTPADVIGSDLTFIGSPSWDYKSPDGKRVEGDPQESMMILLDRTKAEIPDTQNHPFAVFGCGDTDYTHFCGAVDIMEKFVHDVNGNLVTESLRINAYYFNLEQNEQHVRDWTTRLLNSI